MARTITVNLDKPRRLRFSIAAIEDLEQEIGLGGLAAYVHSGQIVSKTITGLYHGLRWEDRELTRDQVRGALQVAIDSGQHVNGIWKQVVAALEGSGVFEPPPPPPPVADADGAGGETAPASTPRSANGSTTANASPSSTSG